MSFADLHLSPSLLRAVQEADYQSPTPIQTAAIPHLLAGRDMFGCAQTGTGKTAAFALPTLQRLASSAAPPRSRPIRVLVLAPTRELASQIGASFRTYGRYTGLRNTVVYGGVGQNPQVRALQHGVDILVATPGRLLDLMNQGHVDLSRVETLILDEADQMLDMGFIHDLKRIVARVPRQRQTLLFSATMPSEIRRLADQWLRDPVTVSVTPQATPAERVSQSVYFVDRQTKPELLAHYVRNEAARRTLVFTRTKHGADKLVRSLQRAGIRAEAIHGNKSQNARERALAQFKSHQPPILVATDIAARGLDIDDVSHVVNFDLPMTPELYVHRIGRTGRAGAEGIAVTFCDRDERAMLREIERLTRQQLSVVRSELSMSQAPAAEPPSGLSRQGRRSQSAAHSIGNGANKRRRFGKSRSAHQNNVAVAAFGSGRRNSGRRLSQV